MPEWSRSGTGGCTFVEHAFPKGVTLSTMARLRGFERTVDEGPAKPPRPTSVRENLSRKPAKYTRPN
jgi:hypothetical protein